MPAKKKGGKRASGWPARWERMIELGQDHKLGPKGEAYLRQKYGQTFKGIPRRRRVEHLGARFTYRPTTDRYDLSHHRLRIHY